MIRMSSSATSTKPSVESTKSQRLDAPLWKYVTITSGSDKSGGNVAFTCNFCGGKLTGSHSRVKSHLLRIKGTGVRIYPTITRDQTVELQALLDHCDQQLNAKAQHKVALPPSSMTGSGTSYFPLREREDEVKKRRGLSPQLSKAFRQEDRRECDASVARLFYSSGLAFNVARNPNYRESYSLASKIPGYVPPESLTVWLQEGSWCCYGVRNVAFSFSLMNMLNLI
ncbi:hypothetical protein ACLB2K_068844 [Fragaria x ananassa]